MNPGLLEVKETTSCHPLFPGCTFARDIYEVRVGLCVYVPMFGEKRKTNGKVYFAVHIFRGTDSVWKAIILAAGGGFSF